MFASFKYSSSPAFSSGKLGAAACASFCAHGHNCCGSEAAGAELGALAAAVELEELDADADDKPSAALIRAAAACAEVRTACFELAALSAAFKRAAAS